MKPLVRYIRACISGEDPHGIMRKDSSTKHGWHSRWYSRLWGSCSRLAVDLPSSKDPRFRASRAREPVLDSAGYQMKQPYRVDIELPHHYAGLSKADTLDLPLQGLPDTSNFSEEIPGLKPVDSRGSLRTGLGKRWDISDNV